MQLIELKKIRWICLNLYCYILIVIEVNKVEQFCFEIVVFFTIFNQKKTFFFQNQGPISDRKHFDSIKYPKKSNKLNLFHKKIEKLFF